MMICTAARNSAFSRTNSPAIWPSSASSAMPHWTGFLSETVKMPATTLTAAKYAKKTGTILGRFLRGCQGCHLMREFVAIRAAVRVVLFLVMRVEVPFGVINMLFAHVVQLRLIEDQGAFVGGRILIHFCHCKRVHG